LEDTKLVRKNQIAELEKAMTSLHRIIIGGEGPMDSGDVIDSSVMSRSISSKVILLSSEIAEAEEANAEL
jgi:hypothetical protein